MLNTMTAKGGNIPPIFNRRDVLLEHLEAILKAKRVEHLHQILRYLNSQPTSILSDLLSDSGRLQECISLVLASPGESFQSVTVDYEKEQLGNVVFSKVSKLETELCAQITGMLLELDTQTLYAILKDEEALEAAVFRAKDEYLKEKHPSSLPTVDDIGEELFKIVSPQYPRNASRITGMLLELNVEQLHHLLDSPSKLEARIEESKTVLYQSSKWIEES